MTNTLDPGYAAAARRRRPGESGRWYDRPAVVLGCLLIGFTLVVAYLQTHRAAPAAAKVHTSLVERVRTAQKQDTALATQLEQLNARLTALREQALPAGGLRDTLATDQLAAGLVAVKGPGIEVVLTEPPAPSPSATPTRAGSTPIAATAVLTDRDVQSVVNELWADGAEAVSVNGIRLTPTAAIRFAGEAVLVDFVPITSPYTVRALGDADALDVTFASSDVASRYQTLVSADGIGFRFTEEKSMTLPAGAPTVLRYAHVPAPATGSASPSESASASPSTSPSPSASGR